MDCTTVQRQSSAKSSEHDVESERGANEESTCDASDLTSINLRSSVIQLAGPAVIRKAFQSLVEMTSLIIVGSLGAEAIAAVGIGKRIVMMATAMKQALSVGATAVVARFIGARDKEGAQSVVTQTVFLSIIVGLFVAIAGVLFSPALMRAMMALQEVPDTEVVRQGATYLRSILAFYVFALPLFMVNAIFQGAGDMKTPMYLMIYMNIVNVILAYVLVNGVGPFPAIGIAGAGIAAGFARGSAGLIGIGILATKRAVVSIDLSKILQFDLEMIQSVMSVGTPAAAEKFVQRFSQILYTMFIAGMGTVAIAANSVAMSIQSLSFIPGFGFSMATTALVGQNLGAQKPKRAEQTGYESYRIAGTLVFGLVAVFMFAPGLITGFYSEDIDVLNLAVVCLRIIGISMPFMVLIQVFSGALRGAGDTRAVLIINTIGNWGVRLLGSYLFGIYFGMGLVGVWIAMAMDQIFRGIFLLLRFRTGAWKEISIRPAASSSDTESEKAHDEKHKKSRPQLPQHKRAAGP